jgi:hypothetical protein
VFPVAFWCGHSGVGILVWGFRIPVWSVSGVLKAVNAVWSGIVLSAVCSVQVGIGTILWRELNRKRRE